MQIIHLDDDLFLNYIGLDDFLTNKQASGRKQDLADIREIKKLQAKGYSRKK
jgi:hypothetical protein